MRKPEKLEELLNAAHNVVMRDGVTRLTLELVARETGLPPAGFPTLSPWTVPEALAFDPPEPVAGGKRRP